MISPAIDRAGYCLYALRDSMNFAGTLNTPSPCVPVKLEAIHSRSWNRRGECELPRPAREPLPERAHRGHPPSPTKVPILLHLGVRGAAVQCPDAKPQANLHLETCRTASR